MYFIIYYLNDLFINLFILILCFLSISFIFSIWQFFIVCYSMSKLLTYNSLFFYFFKYTLYIKILLVQPLLLNGLISIHPPILYASFFFFYIFCIPLYKYFSTSNNFLYSILAFITGGFWSLFLFSWGFYWVYDLIEFLPLFLFYLFFLALHLNFNFLYRFYTHVCFISILLFLLLIRNNLLITRHSFFSSLSFSLLKPYLYFYFIFNSLVLVRLGFLNKVFISYSFIFYYIFFYFSLFKFFLVFILITLVIFFLAIWFLFFYYFRLWILYFHVILFSILCFMLYRAYNIFSYLSVDFLYKIFIDINNLALYSLSSFNGTWVFVNNFFFSRYTNFYCYCSVLPYYSFTWSLFFKKLTQINLFFKLNTFFIDFYFYYFSLFFILFIIFI